jgi:formylglycine-generating enzyme required for sulfatase activity
MLEQVLKEQEFQLTGAVDSETAIEIGRFVGASLVVIGSIVKTGDVYTINSRFIDVETGIAKVGQNIRGQGENQISNMVHQLALIIADKAVTIETPRLKKSPTPSADLPSISPTPIPTVAPTPMPQRPESLQEPISGMEFVWIEAGCFSMGSPDDEIGREDDEGPVHEVCLDGFWMGKYEVTQNQWQQIMGENPSFFNPVKIGEIALTHPVERVSWVAVQQFLQKLNQQNETVKYRLPSEAEWEYAARAGSEKMYFFGNDLDKLKDYAWYSQNSDNKTHPVGQRMPNAWGLYDMHGNVWEWCQDWYKNDYYSESPPRNPTGPSSGETRVLRGGSWNSDPTNCRSADRSWRSPDGWYVDFGARIVADRIETP